MCYTNVVFNQGITRNVNRQEIERQRINDRVGFQSRFQTAGNLIFKPQTQSTLYVQQKQRFNKDHHTNDQIKRQKDKEKQDKFYEARMIKRFERDQQRWEKEQQKQQKSENKRLIHQKVQLECNKNSNALGYNPITLAYDDNNRGKKLRQQDQKKQIHRHVRSKNMDQKNNRNFNIITGQIKQPLSSNIPQRIRPQVQQKYAQKKEREIVKYEPKRDKYDYLDDQN